MDWNAVVTVQEHGFNRALALLGEFGPVSRTDYFNVLVIKVDEPGRMLADLQEKARNDPAIRTIIARVAPAHHTFNFQSAEEFIAQAQEQVLSWLPELAGKSFHTRMHRRGFKNRLSSLAEERLLNELILQALDEAGTPGKINFQDPDFIIMVETVGQRAGLSIWSRDDLKKYPLLRLD